MTSLNLEVFSGPPGSAGANILRSVALSFSAPITRATTNVYNIDHDILYLIGQNRYVVFDAATSQGSSTINVGCTITGNMLPPPQ
jgi:hypothetical protein